MTGADKASGKKEMAGKRQGEKESIDRRPATYVTGSKKENEAAKASKERRG